MLFAPCNIVKWAFLWDFVNTMKRPSKYYILCYTKQILRSKARKCLDRFQSGNWSETKDQRLRYTETSISLFWSFRSRSHFSLPTTMYKTLFDGYQPIEYFILWKFWKNRSYKKNFPWKTDDFFVTLSRSQCILNNLARIRLGKGK